MTQIDNTLTERGSRYGDFDDQAFIVQELKAVMHETPNWDELEADQKEALEMVAHKIGRILNGDPDYVDSWHDIGGYVRLVEQRLSNDQKPRVVQATEQATEQAAEQAEGDCDCPACAIRRELEAAGISGVRVAIL